MSYDDEFVAFDLETHLFKPGDMLPRIVCSGRYDALEGRVFQLRDEFRLWVEEALQAVIDGHIQLINQNIAFDLGCTVANWPELRPMVIAAYDTHRIWCTKLLVHHYDMWTKGRAWRRDYSLGALGKLVGYDLDKDTWRMRYAEFDGMGHDEFPQGAKDYATYDAEAAWMLGKAFMVAHENAGTPVGWIAKNTTYDVALNQASAEGVRPDGEMLERELVPRILGEVEAARETLIEAGYVVPKMVGRGSAKRHDGTYKFEQKRFHAYLEDLEQREGFRLPRTPTGGVSTAEGVILEHTEDPIAVAGHLWGTTRAAEGLVARLRDAVQHGIGHFRFNVAVETNRTSSGGGMLGMNAQNMRREYGWREIWIPKKGEIFGQADAPQIELRALSQICFLMFGHSKMREAFAAGLDPHTVTGAALAGLPDPFKATKKECGAYRNLAKVYNFSVPVGGGEDTFRANAKKQGLEVNATRVSLEEREGWNKVSLHEWFTLCGKSFQRKHFEGDAPELRFCFRSPDTGIVWVTARAFEKHGATHVWLEPDCYSDLLIKFFRLYPEISEYIRHFKDDAHVIPASVGGELVAKKVCNLVVPLSGWYMHERVLTQGANGLFQSLVAAGAKEGLWRCTKEGIRWWNFIHDEVLMAASLDNYQEVFTRGAQLLAEGLDTLLPDCPTGGIEPAASRRWTKGADTYYGSDGVLVPHEDYIIQTWPELIEQMEPGKDRAKMEYELNSCFEFFDRHALDLIPYRP